MKNKINKKGFELSFNAIIIIILAIVFLGIGIFLINKWFQNIDIIIPSTCNIYPPDQRSPICISEKYELELGKSYSLKTAFYNTGSIDLNPNNNPIIQCSNSLQGDTLNFRTSSIGNNLAIGEAKDYNIALQIEKTSKKGTYPCSISLGEMSKQFTIEVK
jgi:hypothetical protein